MPLDRAPVLRGGQIEIDGVQQQAAPMARLVGDAPHSTGTKPLQDADLQPAVDLLRGEFAFFQEFFDQGVVAFGGEIHQIAPQFRHFVLQIGRDGPGLQFAAGAGVGLLADEVHHALEAGLFADGQLEGTAWTSRISLMLFKPWRNRPVPGPAC